MTSNMRRWLRIFAGRVAYVLGTNVHDDQIDEALSDMTTEHGDPPTGTVKAKQRVYESKEGGPQKALKKMKYCRKCRKNVCVCPAPPPEPVQVEPLCPKCNIPADVCPCGPQGEAWGL